MKRKEPRLLRPVAREIVVAEAPLEERFEYRVPDGEWSLGGRYFHSEEELAWWLRHQPPIRAWLDELELNPDAFVQSARHAAYCLVSYACRNMGWDLVEREEPYTWRDFDTGEFLFRDLSEGGTVGMCGPVEVFFDHLLEVVERFAAAAVVGAEVTMRISAEMESARDDFMLYYRDEGSAEKRRSIAQQYTCGYVAAC